MTFNAHIIFVPLPHNPRSGDSINCCYVIKESIRDRRDSSQALFLLNNDERTRSLSRANNYILFQYINNEWQQNQLYDVRVQDSSPQRFRYNIPHIYDTNYLQPVCCICNDNITAATHTAVCCYQGCLSRAHIRCIGPTATFSYAYYICPGHVHVCCLCKQDITEDYGTVSCNQRPQGCLNRAHAPCARYTERGASRVKRFSCPSCKQ